MSTILSRIWLILAPLPKFVTIALIICTIAACGGGGDSDDSDDDNNTEQQDNDPGNEDNEDEDDDQGQGDDDDSGDDDGSGGGNPPPPPPPPPPPTSNSDSITLYQLGTGGSQLVTLGIPFAPSQLPDSDSLQVLDEDGQPVPISVETTLTWHFKSSPQDTIRSVRVQFFVDMDSPTKVYSFNLDGRNTSSDISPQPISNGFVDNNDATKANMPYPEVFAVLSSEWLAQSQIIPPFKGSADDAHSEFWDTQLEWVDDLDYDASSVANWLFDRSTALYKGCMSTEDAACYREAFTSFQYWVQNLKLDGVPDRTSCKGGTLLSNGSRTCDGKYMYLENFKIHLALTGDDTQFDLTFVNDLATTSWVVGQAIAVREPFTNPDGFFTERGAGLTLLAQITAYEMTGSQAALDRVMTGLDNLEAHQASPPDSFTPDGSWRHSWDRHEGNSDFDTGDPDDRRFSPWMSENISDALWHIHFVIDDARIGEMLRQMAGALERWGFADSQGYVDTHGMDLLDYREMRDGYRGWGRSCNEGGPIVMYSGSSVASLDALLNTNATDGYYSDVHNPEVILILTAGYYFENDSDKASALLTRIEDIASNFFNPSCGSISGPERMFSWQNRSNSWGTHLWVVENK